MNIWNHRYRATLSIGGGKVGEGGRNGKEVGGGGFERREWYCALPTASQPGRRVGSKQSFSTTRAAPYMSLKVAVSVRSYFAGPRPGNDARCSNQPSIEMERVHESVIHTPSATSLGSCITLP